MNLIVLDSNLDAISIEDSYKSLIWTERYSQYGDFEFYTPMRDDILNRIKRDYYLQKPDSDRVMIIENILIESDVEEGNHLTLSGRSLESILSRRIIWGLKTISGNFQDGIETLLNECIINPTDADRKIENFVFEASNDPAIIELSIDAQFTGDNLYDIISSACAERHIGFKVILNDRKQFVFKLYAGEDRSYDQTVNPYVIFSPEFENLANSNYLESGSSMKNVTLIGGEGEGLARKYATTGSGTGLNRRETFTDASDISSDDVPVGSTYESLLRQRGDENLVVNSVTISFEGEAEMTAMYKYGEDFFIGDIVQIANEYGHEGKARVTELVISEDESGVSAYPTFETITEEGE